MYEKYLNLTEDEKNEVFEILTQQLDKKHQGLFVCPSMNVPLKVPCSIPNCEKFIENKWYKNCILCYMHKEGKQNLEPVEVAFLLNIPEEQVLNLYNEQMNEIRKKYLLEEVERNGNSLTYLTDIDICCVCESRTNSSIIREGLKFCSPDCLKKKPMFIFDLEREYSCDITTLMEITLKMFKTIDVLESILRISHKKIEFIIRNYARHLSENFFALITTSDDFLCKKERKFKPCMKVLDSMFKQLWRFGKPKKSLSSIYNDLDIQLQNI